MKTTQFQITISPDTSEDNPGLKLRALRLDNQRVSGVDLHRGSWPLPTREVFDLFHLVTEHDDFARINCAKSIGELFAMLSRKEERGRNGKLTYARPKIGGELEIKTFARCLPGLRVDGEVRFDPEKVKNQEFAETVKGPNQV